MIVKLVKVTMVQRVIIKWMMIVLGVEAIVGVRKKTKQKMKLPLSRMTTLIMIKKITAPHLMILNHNKQ